MCELTRERLQQLLAGELDARALEAVAAHLDEECPTCDALLDEHGLDEETLALYLAAARQPEPHPASIERVWAGIERPQARAWSWGLRGWSWGAGGLAFAAAAAILAVAVLPADPDPYTGVKGEAPLPRAGLSLVWLDESTAELHYSLERDAHATVLHLREGEDVTVIHSARALATTRDRLPAAGGALAWSFAGEPGAHLFILVISERPLAESAALALARQEWLQEPDGWTRGRINDRDVGVTMVRTVVP